MEILLPTLDVIRSVAWSMYLGIIVAFATLSIFSKIEIKSYLEWFRKFGVILGLSLGTTLLSSIVTIWFERGTYYPQTSIESLGAGIGFGMWVSNIILEIWTLDPIRKNDLGILDEEHNIETKQRKALSHIRLHALLCIGTYMCARLAS